MPKPRTRVIAEWGSTRFSNIFDRALVDAAEKQAPFPKAKFVLMNKAHPGYKMQANVRYWEEQLRGSGIGIRLLRGDFLRNPLRENSVDELHAHFAFSTPMIGSSGRELSRWGKRRRYVDIRESGNFSNAHKMFSEAARILRKGGRFVVSDCETYIPLEAMKDIAMQHGFKLARVAREPGEIGKYTLVLREFERDDQQNRIKKSFLAEFVKR